MADGGARHRIFNQRVRGYGRDAEYVMSSDRTVDVVAQMMQYDQLPITAARQTTMVALLREVWLDFIRDPAKHIVTLRAAITGGGGGAVWKVDQARRHVLDRGAFPANKDKWTGKPSQVHRIIEADITYYCNAFHRIIPRPEVLQPEAARLHMPEPFRTPRIRGTPTLPFTSASSASGTAKMDSVTIAG
jgi:hypothetical protein